MMIVFIMRDAYQARLHFSHFEFEFVFPIIFVFVFALSAEGVLERGEKRCQSYKRSVSAALDFFLPPNYNEKRCVEVRCKQLIVKF